MSIQTPYSVSTSTASRVSSQTSFASITQTESRRKSSAVTLSTVSSGLKRLANSTSSSSSTSSVMTDPQALPKFVVPGGGAAVYAPPVKPCIVLFAHRVPERGEGEETSRSFLIIDVNAEIIAEEELTESGHTHVQSYRCVLESKGSYLSARRSPETSDPNGWDLAVAGLHKRRAGTETVKRLKHVIIQSDTQNSPRLSKAAIITVPSGNGPGITHKFCS
ncbi:hypothetical protein K432DRAFT_396165 [Lepidopterella palustris CBS 459.81]|uniref:Uncharacterized protein n=1 Tax=Lepidopterella palustris CBS 459.81 TaxID=1314670 RepID=A0A8E2E412_9PEZI|nr:hypothetical protein K432DRAFT_396165 [Lepidopterella palustris CBS 459.81]